MARGFRAEGARLTARLEPYEVAVLRGVVSDVMTLIRSDDAGNAATARLFPDASPDPATAADLRDLLHDDLREAKLENARALLASLPDDGAVSIDREAGHQWLYALNDVRLALGTVIGITEDSYDEEPDEDDEDHEPKVLYGWLTELQATLVEAMSSGRGVGR